MRGLRLFVRPIEGSDTQEITSFLERESPQLPVPACGLLGKLLGDIVAIAAVDLSNERDRESMRLEEIVVARELRRKRIGRAMMRELEQLAKKLDRHSVVVEDARGAQEFFRRVGFENQGERWVRDVR